MPRFDVLEVLDRVAYSDSGEIRLEKVRKTTEIDGRERSSDFLRVVVSTGRRDLRIPLGEFKSFSKVVANIAPRIHAANVQFEENKRLERERRQKERDSRPKKQTDRGLSGGKCSGKTERERAKGKVSYSARKAAKSEASRQLRNQSKGIKGSK